MLRTLAFGEKLPSVFRSHLPGLVGIPVLLTATLVVGSCSERNDNKPSEAHDIEAITEVIDSILPLLSSEGAEGLFTLYTDDVILMVPFYWTDLDREESIAFYADGFVWGKPDPDNYSIIIEEIVVMGDWAFVRQRSQGLVVPANGDPAFLQGSRHLMIFQRQADGTWKIARDMFHNPPIEDLE